MAANGSTCSPVSKPTVYVRAYVEDVRERVREASDERSSEEVKAALEPEIRGAYPTWDASERIGFAVECFYAELNG